MMITYRERSLLIIAIQLAAIAIGVGAALAQSDRSGTEAAQAATHCTRYAATVSQDYNCYLYMTLSPWPNYYYTPGYALRDANTISMAASRDWRIEYDACCAKVGSSSAGSIGASGYYALALCQFSGSNVNGVCWTDWHD